ncbi:acetyl-coenzyme A carboxylase carboxyl transferase subunit beta [Alphaproteobacteria bacterium]|nr:acetyl-coenzyme A carboxylase carboxyl transferase subunit beta [Alphaproteobacteria bacterium]
MSWLTDFVRPKIQKLVSPRTVPENLWDKCPQCDHMIFHRDLEKTLNVCPHCDHHLRLPIKKRLEILFDNGDYQRVELPKPAHDPLKFRDSKRYSDRLADAQKKTEEFDAIVVAHGAIGGSATVVAVFNFDFMGGSMGLAVGEGVVVAAELALLQDAALIVVSASGGARMQEGILSLMQMARTTVAVDRVKEKGLPYIVLLTDPTTGGISASLAMLGDIHIAEPGALIGFAGARVIESTIHEKLPDGFQKAEYLLDHGMVDIVVHRSRLKETIARILSILRQTSRAAPVVPLPVEEPSAPEPDDDENGQKPQA